MSIPLPRQLKDFGDVTYWNTFFTKKTDPFEWYGDFYELESIFSQNIKKTDTVLEVGCGNSSLAAHIWDRVGCKKLIGVDNSRVAINQARKACNSTRPGLQFELVDVFKLQEDLDRLNIDTNTFNCIVDKGTLDAIDIKDTSEKLVFRYFNQISEALALFGRYILITLAQDHILHHIADYFFKKPSCWVVSVSQMTMGIKNYRHLPVFGFVVTKMKENPELPKMRLKALVEKQYCKPFSLLPEDMKRRLREWIFYVTCCCLNSEMDYRNMQLISPATGISVFDCRVGSRNPVMAAAACSARSAPQLQGLLLLPPGHKSPFDTKEGVVELLDSIGPTISTLLIVTTNRLVRFESMERAKERLVVALGSTPIADSLQSLTIFSVDNGFPSIRVTMESEPFVIISEGSKKKKKKPLRSIARVIEPGTFHVVSDTRFGVSSSPLFFAWLLVVQNYLEGSEGLFIGLPPCIHPLITKSLDICAVSDGLMALARELRPDAQFKGSEKEYFYNFVDPAPFCPRMTVEEASVFLQGAPHCLAFGGLSCIFLREGVDWDLIKHMPAEIECVVKQKFEGAAMWVFVKKQESTSKPAIIARLRKAVDLVPDLRGVLNNCGLPGETVEDVVARMSECLKRMKVILKDLAD